LNRNEPINEKYLGLQKLTAGLDRLNKASDLEKERKYSIIVASIISRIKEKVREFAKSKGYVLVLDKYDDAFMIEGEIVDATSEFINFCNESFDKEKLK
jgi:Skp family chaperone for outer membrane proteins